MNIRRIELRRLRRDAAGVDVSEPMARRVAELVYGTWSRRAAEEALLDQVFFSVSQDAYDEFLARLDAPPRPNERLKRALRKPPVWG